MILRLYQSKKDLYVKPEMVDAVIPVLNEQGYVLYSTVIINGIECKVEGDPDVIIHSKMKMDW